jgi:hypothetical protein
MRLLLVAGGLLASCATAPDWVISDDYPSRSAHAPLSREAGARARSTGNACQLWSTRDVPQKKTVLVVEGRALQDSALGGRQLARLDEGGIIACDGARGEQRCGQVKDGRLTIKQVLGELVSEPIGGGTVRIPGALHDTVYEYSPGCSLPFVAVGAMALHILDEEERRRPSDDRRERVRSPGTK